MNTKNTLVKNKKYEDVVVKKKKDTLKVRKLHYWEYKGMKFFVDGKNILFDYSNYECEVAQWLVETFGGDLLICPRVNYPEGIQTPDFIWNNEKWDLKTIYGTGKRTIEDCIKKKREQSHNFIFDASFYPKDINNLIIQIQKIFNNKSTEWVDKIILKYNDDVILFYEKKKK